jgi:hypothetical protein
VGLTGIIYGSIVVAWAAYLVPMWLRRHDEAARSRSVARFSSSMRVLSRSGGSGRMVVSPPRTTDRVLSPGLGSSGSTAVNATAARPSRKAQRVAARRRRRVLFGLLIGTAVVAAAAVLGYLPLWSVGVPLAMTAAFLLLARHQVRRASDSFWVEAQADAPAPTNVVRRGSTRVDATHGTARPADDEPTVPLDAEDLRSAVAGLEQQHSVAVALPTSDGSSLWDPLPIMLPTYVDKAAARRTIRTVDLGESSSRTAGQAAKAAPQPASVADDEVRAEPARVVNG